LKCPVTELMMLLDGVDLLSVRRERRYVRA